MKVRTQVAFDFDMHQHAKARAAELGISLAEYVRRLLAQDLGEVGAADLSLVFDLVTARPRTNVARDKDQMLGEAVSDERSRSTDRKRIGPALRLG